ncbi:Holliday junction recognition protein isoform X2 [Heliangelus exortis]|uniref:Holliday junction recognition protein isoform X2 n=1 Tax=Heliangelus exortis TaxID=472823 RepID=UPI003A904ED1
MAFDLEERLRQSNDRFLRSINRIVEQYNFPFEDDYLVSMETLTYDTPQGQKSWEDIKGKDIRKLKKSLFKQRTRGRQKDAEMPKQQTNDFEDGHSTVHEESPENSCMDTSDAGEETDADILSVRRKFENIHFQNQYVGDGNTQETIKIQVDPIVQDPTRNISPWIKIAPPATLTDLHLTSPVRGLIGHQAPACRMKQLSNDCSLSRPPQFQLCSLPISPCPITLARHQSSPELKKSCYDSIFQEYQSADEECSWSNITLADLYPAMLNIFTVLMTRQPQRKEFKKKESFLAHFKHRRSRCRKLNITVYKIRGFRPPKLKRTLLNISSGSKDTHNQASGNEHTEFCAAKCSVTNLPDLLPYSSTDESENNMDCSDLSLEHHLLSGEGQNVSKQTVFPNVMPRMGETFLVEDELQIPVSWENSKWKESKKLAYKSSSECHSKSSVASPDSTALHLVKENVAQNSDFHNGDALELCSFPCSSYGSSSIFTHVTNCSPAKAPNPSLSVSEKKTSEYRISFQGKYPFPSLSVTLSPSKMPQKYEDAFEKLYYRLCSKESRRPLQLAKPLPISQNLEVEGRCLKSNLSGSVRFPVQCAREFDQIYEHVCAEAVPKLPGFQRAFNLRKYEGIQMSETVNALVNSPVRTSAISRVKRQGNFQNDIFSSPVKRLKNIPERYFLSTKCQQIPQRKNVHPHTAGMEFLSTCNKSNPSFFDSHSCQSQDSGFHASSDKTFLCAPGTSLQESGIADVPSAWPKAMKSDTCLRSEQKCCQRVFRKLSYTDGKDKF